MARHTLSDTPNWMAPVTIVALVLGFLIVSAWETPKDARGPGLYSPRSGVATPPTGGDLGESLDQREDEIKRLREQVTQLEDAIADRSRQAKLLNENLQQAKMLADLTEVEGSGIEIILRDSKRKTDDPFLTSEYVIHDTDVLRVVNELWMSGAEAVAVNNQRLSSSSSFRCEGPVIYVGHIPMSSPIKIWAIGDVDTLYGALTMPGRYLDNIKTADSGMVEVRKRDRLVLPASTGSSEFKHAKSVAAKP